MITYTSRILIPLLLIVMFLGGCTTNSSQINGGTTSTPSTPAPTQTATKSVTLYYPDEQVENLVPVTLSLEQTSDSLELATLNALIKGTNMPAKSANPFPADLKVISMVVLNEGNVTIDFNDALYKIQGSAGERAALNSLLKTLSQFPAYKTLTLTVNGKKVDSLGHYDLTQPLPFDKLL